MIASCSLSRAAKPPPMLIGAWTLPFLMSTSESLIELILMFA